MRWPIERAMHCVDSGRRHNQSSSANVRCRDSKFTPQPIAALNNASERILPPRHLPREIEVAILDRLANARAAHGLFVERHCRQTMHHKLQFFTETLQQGHISGSPKAKMKAASYTDAMDAPKRIRQFPNELLACLLAQRLVKFQEQGRIRVQCGNRAQLLRQRINQWWNPFRHYDRIRVPIKCYYHRNSFMLCCVTDRLPNHLLMTQVDAVKHSTDQSATRSTTRK